MINEVQAELYSRVAAISSLTVYGHVPQDTAIYPYVVVDTLKANANDTDSETGFDATIMIHIWSSYKGSKETELAQKLIYDALHRTSFDVTGWGISAVQQEFTEILLDPDGITRHGVQRFRVIFEPTA